MECKKIIIPIHCKDDDSQLKYARKLEQIFVILGHKVHIVNLDGAENPLYIQAYIEEQKAQLLVTIDCSGFDLKLLGDDLFYNSLCVPAMHFLLKKPQELKNELSERMNFNMEFYVGNEDDKEFILNRCRRVPNVQVVPRIFQVRDFVNYLPSEQIIFQVNSLPDVFKSIFVHSVECKEKDMSLSNIQILDNYLQQYDIEVSSEEKNELIPFVDMAFLYVDSVIWESCAKYIENELNRIFG